MSDHSSDDEEARCAAMRAALTVEVVEDNGASVLHCSLCGAVALKPSALDHGPNCSLASDAGAAFLAERDELQRELFRERTKIDEALKRQSLIVDERDALRAGVDRLRAALETSQEAMANVGCEVRAWLDNVGLLGQLDRAIETTMAAPPPPNPPVGDVARSERGA